ncbi:MAG: hypothetical protein KC486_13675 [Myxococcales bacterium]|nr:hypothetical protein [Myxococcales bacterium]
MRLPRKGILIRILVYGTALGYFGWQALSHYFDERAAEEAAAGASDDVTKREYKLPDGRSVEVLELTPEQAERMYGVSPSVGPADDGAKDADAEAPAKGEGAEAAPTGEAAPDKGADAPAEAAETAGAPDEAAPEG